MAFDAQKGFLLNGKPYVIKGTCNHQDHAGVGAAMPDQLQYFRIARLKEMGSNAYRTSHNPPTPELLEACDRLGMLVMDENRLLGSDAANTDSLESLSNATAITPASSSGRLPTRSGARRARPRASEWPQPCRPRSVVSIPPVR